jgi:cytochrome c oxidase assembly protein subunit 15
MRLSRFAALTLGFTLAVILWGAFVRASGSGAGCGAHWPLCNGEVLPRSPAVATRIELTHRVTSGLALVLVIVLALRVFRERPRAHPARVAAALSVAFILTEAAVGAGLVLFRLVAHDESVARALFMAVHLVNTFLLLGALTLTAHWSAHGAGPARESLRRRGPFLVAVALALLLVGTSGAIAALGDTLYPARSLLGGLAQDLSPAARTLVRLRLLHPLLAVAGTLALALLAGRVMRDRLGPARRVAATALVLAALQLGAGLANVLLLAPIFMQILHLLLADLLWIAFCLLAARLVSDRPDSGRALASAA